MDDPELCQRLLRLTVHDLRNSVNSLQLSMHLLRGGLPAAVAGEAQADLSMLDSGIEATRLMVETLGAFTRSLREGDELHLERRSARRLLDEAVQTGAPPARLGMRVGLSWEDGAAADPEVLTDPSLVVRAVELAIRNALAASRKHRVRLEGRSDGDRWRVAVVTEEPPMATVESGPIEPGRVEHLTASPHERRTLDLALVGWISARLGGSAWLEVRPGRDSRIVLDWPLQVPIEEGVNVGPSA